MQKDVHVTYDHDKDHWEVKLAGDASSMETFSTKELAEAAGKQKAKDEKSELVIHDQNGTIREKISYGNDPRSSDG